MADLQQWSRGADRSRLPPDKDKRRDAPFFLSVLSHALPDITDVFASPKSMRGEFDGRCAWHRPAVSHNRISRMKAQMLKPDITDGFYRISRMGGRAFDRLSSGFALGVQLKRGFGPIFEGHSRALVKTGYRGCFRALSTVFVAQPDITDARAGHRGCF
jgi:hypothetical protein